MRTDLAADSKGQGSGHSQDSGPPACCGLVSEVPLAFVGTSEKAAHSILCRTTSYEQDGDRPLLLRQRHEVTSPHAETNCGSLYYVVSYTNGEFKAVRPGLGLGLKKRPSFASKLYMCWSLRFNFRIQIDITTTVYTWALTWPFDIQYIRSHGCCDWHVCGRSLLKSTTAAQFRKYFIIPHVHCALSCPILGAGLDVTLQC